jgi:hypothetical protein
MVWASLRVPETDRSLGRSMTFGFEPTNRLVLRAHFIGKYVDDPPYGTTAWSNQENEYGINSSTLE